MEPLGVTATAHLFPGLHEHLMALLRGLSPEGWLRPTLARNWCVRDIALHLLDGDVRRLSFQRDGLPLLAPDAPVSGHDEFVRFLNGLNADWIRATRRVSPRLLMDLLDLTGPQVAALFASLDPHGRAFFAVTWAGQAQSEHWLDIGRDYTERWHHQAQIRDAVGAPPLDGREWLRPVIELSTWAFCRGFSEVSRPPGAALVLDVTGEAGGTWSIVTGERGWMPWRGALANPAARVRLSADTAWRLFFNALPADAARARVEREGDPELIDRFLSVRAVMV